VAAGAASQPETVRPGKAERVAASQPETVRPGKAERVAAGVASQPDSEAM